MTGFFSALTYPFRGVAYFLRRPALWKYAAGAFAINIVLFAVLIALYVAHRESLVALVTPDRFPSWLRTATGWILSLFVALVGLFLFSIVGNMLASPFLDALTERILREEGETLPQGRGPLRALGRALVNQTLKLLFFGAVQALLLVLWITPLGVLHPPLSALVAVLFLGFEYLDYPLDARGVPVPGRISWILAHAGAALGYGSVLFLVLLVPFLGYFCLPLSVAGAALLAHRIDSPSARR
jgi:CysZ protein